jgi:hypothetical protein
MAMALIARAAETYPPAIHPAYKEQVLGWERRAAGMRLGCVQGALRHLWHGPLSARQYMGRWEILLKHAFDPDTHMAVGACGFAELTAQAAALEADIMTYFRQRNEDSTEVEAPDVLREGQRAEAAKLQARAGGAVAAVGSGSFGAAASASAAPWQPARPVVAPPTKHRWPGRTDDGDSGDEKPDSGDEKPDGGDEKPDGGDEKPDGGDGKPDAGDGKPDAGDGKPDAGDGKPDAGDGKPDAGDGKPDGGDEKPSQPDVDDGGKPGKEEGDKGDAALPGGGGIVEGPVSWGS